MPYSRFVIAGLSLLFALPVQAELKKWVDEKGQVHYGDTIPTRYLRKEHQIMNEEGVVVEEVPAAKTESELLEEKRQKKLAEIKAQKERQQAFRDRVLLDTYTTERDLMKAREERVSTFTSLITLTGSIIKSNQEQLDRLLKRKAEFERLNKPLPPTMLEQERILVEQIKDNRVYVEDQKQERQKIIDQFDEDLARYSYLKKQEQIKKLERERRLLERRRKEEELLNLPAQ